MHNDSTQLQLLPLLSSLLTLTDRTHLDESHGSLKDIVLAQANVSVCTLYCRSEVTPERAAVLYSETVVHSDRVSWAELLETGTYSEVGCLPPISPSVSQSVTKTARSKSLARQGVA